jgi:ketosteroid isomerase-like protein
MLAADAPRCLSRFARCLGSALLAALHACTPTPSPPTAGVAAADVAAADVAAARALFEQNLRAIQAKDRAAYLACYRDDEALVRVGPDGPKLGFAELAAHTSSTTRGWPESLEPSDVQLHWLAPGWVYGSYRYRVVFDGVASEGLSERVFARQDGRWQIMVSTAFGGPASSDARLAPVAFLAGRWVEQGPDRTTEEVWSPARGGTMLGHSRTLEGDTTTSFEFLRLELTTTGVELVALPGGLTPTRFRLTTATATRVVFTNPANDYPQRISYAREGPRLTARIEGGGPAHEWRYTRD